MKCKLNKHLYRSRKIGNEKEAKNGSMSCVYLKEYKVYVIGFSVHIQVSLCIKNKLILYSVRFMAVKYVNQSFRNFWIIPCY